MFTCAVVWTVVDWILLLLRVVVVFTGSGVGDLAICVWLVVVFPEMPDAGDVPGLSLSAGVAAADGDADFSDEIGADRVFVFCSLIKGLPLVSVDKCGCSG